MAISREARTGDTLVLQPGQTVLVQKVEKDDGTTAVYIKIGYISEDGTKLLMPDEYCWTPIRDCEAWLQDGFEAVALYIYPPEVDSDNT